MGGECFSKYMQGLIIAGGTTIYNSPFYNYRKYFLSVLELESETRAMQEVSQKPLGPFSAGAGLNVLVYKKINEIKTHGHHQWPNCQTQLIIHIYT